MKLSAYRNTKDTDGVDVAFDTVVRWIEKGLKGLDEKTKHCHDLAQTDKAAYRDYKATQLPAVTFAGTFPKRHRKANALAVHSGQVVLDIDDLPANDLPSLSAALAQLQQVKLAFLSPSGRGIKIVVSVDPVPADAAEHTAAWQACVDFFENIAEEHGFEIDPSGKDCSRLCFLAHDPQAIVHADALPIHWDREAYLHEKDARQQRKTDLASKDWGTHEKDLKVLDFITGVDDYERWIQVGMAIKNSDLPCDLWDQWSRTSAKYQPGECQKRWETFGDYSGTPVTWGSLVYLAEQNGYQPPQRNTYQKAKLHRNGEAPEGARQTLAANRDTRSDATETFLKEHTAEDTLHIQLIKDFTGTGKTHTLFQQAKAQGKRTLAQLPHTALAAQAVETARTVGFTNPVHLTGREQQWEASGIAEIPPAQRTRDLFEKNNCIMVDELQKYTDKRVSPRTYCELQCRFRDGCPHLAQYERLTESDFIATCAPNLLFDLNMSGYLEKLVSATDAPTDEDLAIDAMLGTQSPEPTGVELAIVDDYSLNGLYSDISWKASEFKALEKAWEGTPTGAFARDARKAFKKKKPQKILKALRAAFEKHQADHREIAKNLTQHARTGRVERTDRPKGSQQTRRLLSEKQVKYEDGGTQCIPVDFDAYQELTEKGIPTVHPQLIETEDIGETVRVPHSPQDALRTGVPLATLTPIWIRGATPIELLGIFLKSVGNDKNAPLKKTFTGGESPDARLDFSIPPQAPVGLIPRIALLSATTDTDDTQHAFDGQAVTFSAHTGQPIAWADDVKVYQFQDARNTSGSVFEKQKDDTGKWHATDLKKNAARSLRKLNTWAKATDGRTAFISYKELTEQFREAVKDFDCVTHFDKVAGLNFDGLKLLVVFGYPKVKHEVVMEYARKQCAADSDPLPKADPTLRNANGTRIRAYLQLTEDVTATENGITITERRYLDPRLEKIRQQLATEKLEQAIGRARLATWTGTTSLIFTNAPIDGITERATLFDTAAFLLAETPNALPDAMQQIQHARETGDIQAVMATIGVRKSQAYALTKEIRDQQRAARDTRIIALHQQGDSLRTIENSLKAEGKTKVSRSTIHRVIQVSQNSSRLREKPLKASEKWDTPPETQTVGKVVPRAFVLPPDVEKAFYATERLFGDRESPSEVPPTFNGRPSDRDVGDRAPP